MASPFVELLVRPSCHTQDGMRNWEADRIRATFFEATDSTSAVPSGRRLEGKEGPPVGGPLLDDEQVQLPS
jgi:hypothetical protein